MARPPTPQERELASRLEQRDLRRQYKRDGRSIPATFGRELPGEWADDGKCHGRTDLFYSFDPDDEQTAKQICAECPVIDECRAYARRNREFGTWGGETELDRAIAGHGNPLMVGKAAKAHYRSGGLAG